MVQRDQNRVVLGAVAAAGVMFVLYIIGKKLTRRKAGKGDSSQQQPQGGIELEKSSKSPIKAEPLTPNSDTMSAPATGVTALSTAVESKSTYSFTPATRTREGSMFYDSYGGHQRTHTADTMSHSKQPEKKLVMAETMSEFKSPRVSWYSGNMPPRSTVINTTSQAETLVSMAETQPRVSANIQNVSASDEPPAKMKPPMYYDHYGGNFMTHTSYTLSVSSKKDTTFVVSESMSESKGPRVAWHAEDNEPIIVPVSREAEPVEKVVSSQEEVLKAEVSTEYKEVVYSMAKGTADEVTASTLTLPSEPEKGNARKDEADGSGADVGGTQEAQMVAQKAQKQEANLVHGKQDREFGAGVGREAGDTKKAAKEEVEEEEATDGPVFKPAWMKKSSKAAGSAGAISSLAVANGQRRVDPSPRVDSLLARVSSGQAAAAAPLAAAAAAAPMDMTAVTGAIMASQSRPDRMSEKDVATLVSILQQPNPSLLLTALGCISRCANFTQNQRLLREAGCVERLQALLETHGPGAKDRVTTDEAILASTLMVITNMTTDLENQARLEVCLQPLMELVLSGKLSKETSLSALQVLTNLSVTSAFHGHYTRGVQQLYELLELSDPPLQLQLLRILVNLSCNPNMAPHLLAAKAPGNLLALLETDEKSGLPLRAVTFLANVEAVVQQQQLSPSALPTLDKAASPETLFSIMHGQLSRSNLRSKVFRLTNSTDEDVAHHACRLYGSLGAT